MELRAVSHLLHITDYNTDLAGFLHFRKMHSPTPVVLFGQLRNKILGIDSKAAIQTPWCALETYTHLRPGADTWDNTRAMLWSEALGMKF